MRSRVTLSCAVASVLLACGAVWAQQESKPVTKPPSAEPAMQSDAKPASDAEALLNKSKEAAKALKDLDCQVIVEGKGANLPERLAGRAVFTFAEGQAEFPIVKWYFEVASSKPDAKLPQSVHAFDGNVMRELKHDRKKMLETDAADGMAAPTGETPYLLPAWFLEQRGEQEIPGLRTTDLKIEGPAEVNGVKCTIVYRVRKLDISDDEPPQSAEKPAEPKQPAQQVETLRVYIADADHLARKIETKFERTGGSEPAESMAMTYTLSNVKANSKPPDELFVLKTPEGYAVKKVDPNSRTLDYDAGDPCPDFVLTDSAGKSYKLSDFKGKVVVLDFWATWCGPCKRAMPAIQKLHERFKDKSVAICGVNTWEKVADAGPKYMEQEKLTYLSLLKGDEFAKTLGITSIPTFVVIGPDGKILHTAVGFDMNAEDQIAKIIDEELAKGVK